MVPKSIAAMLPDFAGYEKKVGGVKKKDNIV